MPATPRFLEATTSGQFQLWHGSLLVGNWLESWVPNIALVTAPAIRHNFWATYAKIDAAYDTPYYRHNFLVYIEATLSPSTANGSRDLANLIYSYKAHYLQGLQSLLIKKVVDDSIVGDFGQCALEVGPEMKEPSALGYHTACLVNFSFLGASMPVFT